MIPAFLLIFAGCPRGDFRKNTVSGRPNQALRIIQGAHCLLLLPKLLAFLILIIQLLPQTVNYPLRFITRLRKYQVMHPCICHGRQCFVSEKTVLTGFTNQIRILSGVSEEGLHQLSLSHGQCQASRGITHELPKQDSVRPPDSSEYGGIWQYVQ